jgi:Icc protein
LVLATGDITHEGARVAYERFRNHLAVRTNAPLVCLPGNHDLADAFGEISDPVTLHPWRIIAIDSHVDDEVGGTITNAELARLDAEICAAPEFVIIALHHPVLACGSPWLDKDGIFSGRLHKIIESSKKVRCVVHGHIHQAFEKCHNGVLYLGTPSTCYQFEPRSKSFSIDSSLPGYRWLSLSDTGDIDTQVSRIS